MSKLMYILLFLIFSSCGTKHNSKNVSFQIDNPKAESSNSSNWTFDKIQGSKLVFKDAMSFETNLFELEYIGHVQIERKAPYLIFSGRDCNVCDANISIYIHSPDDGHLIVANGQNRYQYPGTEKYYENDSIVYQSRAFYGQILNDTEGVIWYENRLTEDGKMARLIYLVRLGNVKQDTSFTDDGRLDETINLLKQGLCKEIKGRNFTSEP
jgi:hypothetical protein